MPEQLRPEHREIVAKIIDGIFNENQLDLIDEVYAEDVEIQPTSPPDGMAPRAFVRAMVQMLRSAIPDNRFEVVDARSTADGFVMAWKCIGTHEGPMQYGPVEISGTRSRGPAYGTSVATVVDGRVTAVWQTVDVLPFVEAAHSANVSAMNRWFREVWNERNYGAIAELFAADGVAHGLPAPLQGPKEFEPFARGFHDAFDKLDITVEHVIAQGDWVAVRCRACVERGELCSEFPGMTLVRMRDGQIVEAHNAWDFLKMATDLGAAGTETMATALKRAP